MSGQIGSWNGVRSGLSDVDNGRSVAYVGDLKMFGGQQLIGDGNP